MASTFSTVRKLRRSASLQSSTSIGIQCWADTSGHDATGEGEDSPPHLHRRDLVKILKRTEELEHKIAKAGGDWTKVIPGGNPFGNYTITKLIMMLGGPFSPGTGKVMLHVMHKNPVIFYDSMIQFSHIFSIYYTLLGVLGIEQASQSPGVSWIRELARFFWMLQGCWCLTGLVMCLHVMILMQRMTPWELQASLFQKPVTMSLSYSLGPVAFFFVLLALVSDAVAHFFEVSDEYGQSKGNWTWLFLVIGIAIGLPLLFGFLQVSWLLSDAARPYEHAYHEYLQETNDLTSRTVHFPDPSLESLFRDSLNELQGQRNNSGMTIDIDISALAKGLESQGITAKAVLAAAETGQSQLLNDLFNRPELGLNLGETFAMTTALIKYGSKSNQPRTNMTLGFW